MRLLITGGFGYIGGRLVEALRIDEKFELRVHIHKMLPSLADWAKGLDIVVADVTRPETLGGICDGVDAVVHLASTDEIECQKNPLEALDVNVRGTYHILQEALESGAKRFIYFSTFRVYGETKGVLVHENLIPKPLHHYGITRLMAEQYVRQAGTQDRMKTIIVRLSNAFGAPICIEVDRWSLVFNDLCRQAVRDGKLILRTSGLQHRDFIAMPDVVQAIRLLLASPDDDLLHDIYNIGSGTSMTIRQVAEMVREVYLDCCGEEIPLQAPEPRPGETHEPVRFDISRMRALGFIPEADAMAEVRRTIQVLQNRYAN